MLHPQQTCKNSKKAIRIITNSAYNAHASPLFLQHKNLPLEKIIKQAKLTFMHSYHFNYAPKSVTIIWQNNAARHQDVNLRNDELYALPKEDEPI